MTNAEKQVKYRQLNVAYYKAVRELFKEECESIQDEVSEICERDDNGGTAGPYYRAGVEAALMEEKFYIDDWCSESSLRSLEHGIVY